jgi:hypothetical protein
MRTFLTVRETAFLLQRSEMAVRRMIEANQLRCLGNWETVNGSSRRRLSPDSVSEPFPNDGSYQLRRLGDGGDPDWSPNGAFTTRALGRAGAA